MTSFQPADHRSQISRVNRIAGQIGGIRNMIEERRYCMDILAQTRAAKAALQSLEADILSEHIGHCIHDATESGDVERVREMVDEVTSLFRKSKVT